MTANGKKRRGGTDYDGIVRRRSTVTIEMDAIGGMLYDKQGIDAINSKGPGFLGSARKDIIEQHYIITTRRYDSGRWEVVVHQGGEDHHLPDEVLAVIRRHYAAIIKTQQQERGEEQANRRRAARLLEDDAAGL